MFVSSAHLPDHWHMSTMHKVENIVKGSMCRKSYPIQFDNNVAIKQYLFIAGETGWSLYTTHAANDEKQMSVLQ